MKTFILLLISILSFQFTLTAQASTDGLKLYLPFNGNTEDVSGNENHAIAYGAELTQDRFGNVEAAYFFDGIEDYIEILNNNLSTTTEATISFWFAPSNDWNAESVHEVFMQSDVGGDFSGHFLIAFNRTNCGSFPSTDDGKINLELQGDFENANSENCDGFGLTRVGTNQDNWLAGEWHHLSFVISSGLMSVYVDGEPQGSKETTSGVFTEGLPVFLGRYFAPQQLSAFNGSLDDIRFYDRGLTQEELTELLTSNKPISFSNSIKIFPNPSSDILFIDVENDGNVHSITIINALGQTVVNQTMAQQQLKIDVSNLSSSNSYFVQFYNEDGMMIDVKKIVIQ